MKHQAIQLLRAARARLSDEAGQAMTEYASVSFLLLAGGLAMSGNLSVFKALFVGLQTYVSFYFYALNLAIG